ncbi:hypothetical protein [Rhizobium sp. G21]|uniref:hypothetical protein n=1 Tax=Rhizobium sp. G21 TaxID=2758439 RepID=UPI0016046E3C|nr:hypothetical protein [Rhizobium sp. G21]MBB1247431.1 hypothetical protein [Rhizobium sp. G21]
MNRDLVKFNVLRNALYHTSRRLTFDRWNRWFNFLIIALGAQAVTSFMLLVRIDMTQTAVGALVATVGALQLVFDFGGKARDHQSLQREYYHLLADIEAHPDADDAQLANWQSQMTRIAGDEPPVLRALDSKAYNDAIGATEQFDTSERLFIPWTHRVFGQIWSYDGYDYKKLSELPATHRAHRAPQVIAPTEDAAGIAV